MATGNIVSICNRALLSIGARAQISNLNEGSTESDACTTLFTPVFESLGRAANWNCLRTQNILSLLTAAQGTPENPNGTTLPLSPQPWLYSYQYPSDCLQVRFIQPNYVSQTGGSPTPVSTVANQAQPWVGQNGSIPFVVAYSTDSSNNPLNIILTNQSQAEAIYTVNQPNPQIWDSEFQSAMVASLAAYLVPALSLSIPLMDRQIKIAEGLITRARVRDGDEGDTVQDHLPDWVRARGWGAGYVNYWNNNNYQDMAWPG